MMWEVEQSVYEFDGQFEQIFGAGARVYGVVTERIPAPGHCPTHLARVDLCACNNKEESVSRKDIILSRMKQLEAEMAELEKLPDEPKAPENSPFPPAIYFVKQFPGSNQEYTYLLYKAPHDGRWYASGSRQVGKSYTWDELTDWLKGTGPLPTIYEVLSFGEYWAPEDGSGE